MARNKIQDLRDNLFEVIEKLKDEDENFSIDKAKAIAELAQVIVNSAKVEVDFIRTIEKLNGIVEKPRFFRNDDTPKEISQKLLNEKP